MKITKSDKFAGNIILSGAVILGLESFDLNPVEWIAGLLKFSKFVDIVYSIIGIAAIYLIYRIFRGFK